jgi:hypothetical protein
MPALFMLNAHTNLGPAVISGPSCSPLDGEDLIPLISARYKQNPSVLKSEGEKLPPVSKDFIYPDHQFL